MTTMRRTCLLLWAALGMPFVFMAFVWFAYSTALANNAMPAYQDGPILLFWLPVSLLALSGVISLFHALPLRLVARVSVVLVYCFVSFWALAWGGLLIACQFGDCI